MISSISILQDSQYLGGKGGGVVWPLMSKKNYEVFFKEYVDRDNDPCRIRERPQIRR